MKQVLAIILLIALARPAFPFLEYAVNYDYIATVLCVNKDKPKLECNGKCYLMKQLAKNASEKESSSKKKILSQLEFQLVYFEIVDIPDLSPQFIAIPAQRQKVHPEPNYAFLFQHKLLKPPRA